MSRILQSDFRYTNAADSSKPNYLKLKFDKIRRELREAKQKAEAEANTVEAAVKIRMLRS